MSTKLKLATAAALVVVGSVAAVKLLAPPEIRPNGGDRVTHDDRPPLPDPVASDPMAALPAAIAERTEQVDEPTTEASAQLRARQPTTGTSEAGVFLSAPKRRVLLPSKPPSHRATGGDVFLPKPRADKGTGFMPARDDR